MFLKSTILFIFVLLYLTTIGQNTAGSIYFKSDFKEFKIKYSNEIEKSKILSREYLKFIKKGHCFVQFQSVGIDSILIEKGPIYKTIVINENDIEKKISLVDISEWMLNRITKDANNGYPFSKIYLSEISFLDSNDVRGKLNYDSGIFLNIAKIHCKGDSSISKDLIELIINIKENNPYCEDKIRRIDLELIESQYIEILKPSEILFTEEGVEIYCYLKRKKSSLINGLIGIQPNSDLQRIGLTGDIQIKLLNSLKRGELIAGHWKNVLPKTSSFNSELNLPYIFKSQFDLNAILNLYKRDTMFFELDSRFNIAYKISNSTNIKAVYNRYINNTINTIGNIEFGNNANVNTNFLGLQVLYSNKLNLNNPISGSSFGLEFLTGLRKINNSSLNNSTVYKIAGDLNYFFNIQKRHVFKISSTFKVYLSDSIFTNERFRLGGISSIRGFNEETVFSSSYLINNLEYRFRLDNSSYVFTFIDQAITQDKSIDDSKLHPIGFGIGFAYSTNIGVFNIVGAYGKSEIQSLNIRDPKIHFGYVSFF